MRRLLAGEFFEEFQLVSTAPQYHSVPLSTKLSGLRTDQRQISEAHGEVSYHMCSSSVQFVEICEDHVGSIFFAGTLAIVQEIDRYACIVFESLFVAGFPSV